MDTLVPIYVFDWKTILALTAIALVVLFTWQRK